MSVDPSDRQVVKALGHPLRVRILERLVLAGERSPSNLARELEQPLATVSKHVRLLRELDFVELTRTVQRRGAVEHFYRAKQLAYIDDAEWAELPVTLRRSLVWRLFRDLFAEASASGGHGGFDAPEMHIARFPLALDERGRQELSRVLHSTLREAEAVQRRSDQRTGGRTGAARPSTLGLLHFEAVVADDATTSTPERPGLPSRDGDVPPRQH